MCPIAHIVSRNRPYAFTMGKIDERLLSVGRAVAKARETNGLTQEQLAHMIDMSDHSFISKIENGKRIPSMQRLLTLADALDVEISYFVMDVRKLDSPFEPQDPSND